MDSIYTLNHYAIGIDSLDAIGERLAKASTTTNSLLATRYSDIQLSCDSIHNSSWAIHDYLPEAI